MISGLLKFIRRLSLAGYQRESQLSPEIHSSIDSGPASTEVGWDRSGPAHLDLCNGYCGTKEAPVAPA